MANHKSALKRNRQSLVRRARNRANRSRMKSVIKAVDAAIAEGNVEKVRSALKDAIPVIDRTAIKGTIHRKTASRNVSRLTQRVNDFIKEKEAAA